MNYDTKYTTMSFYVEHDDFFKYIREYLQEESSHMYYKEHVDDDKKDMSSEKNCEVEHYEFY